MEKRGKVISIPILEEDSLFGIIEAFLLELHENEIIYISNGTEGLDIATSILELMKKLGIVRKESWE